MSRWFSWGWNLKLGLGLGFMGLLGLHPCSPLFILRWIAIAHFEFIVVPSTPTSELNPCSRHNAWKNWCNEINCASDSNVVSHLISALWQQQEGFVASGRFAQSWEAVDFALPSPSYAHTFKLVPLTFPDNVTAVSLVATTRHPEFINSHIGVMAGWSVAGEPTTLGALCTSKKPNTRPEEMPKWVNGDWECPQGFSRNLNFNQQIIKEEWFSPIPPDDR